MNNIGKIFKMNNNQMVILERVERDNHELYCEQCYFHKQYSSCILTRADMFKGMGKQFTKDIVTYTTFTDGITIPECYDGVRITSIFKVLEGGV